MHNQMSMGTVYKLIDHAAGFVVDLDTFVANLSKLSGIGPEMLGVIISTRW